MPPLGSPPHGGGSAPAGAPYPDPIVPYGSGTIGNRRRTRRAYGIRSPSAAGANRHVGSPCEGVGRGGKRWSPNRWFGRLDGRVEALPFRIQFRCRVARLAPFPWGPSRLTSG